jgi:hypothetical protein
MRQLRKSALPLTLLLAMTSGGIAAGSAVAAADEISPANLSCSSSLTTTCIWVNSHYGGAKKEFSANNLYQWSTQLGAQSQCTGGTWSDCASSIWNRNYNWNEINLYKNVSYTGGRFIVPVGVWYAHLGNFSFDSGGGLVGDNASSSKYS